MTQVIVTVPAVAGHAEVKSARVEFVGALGTVYGAGRRYAATLVAFFRAEGFGDDWITMDHDEKGRAGDAMREERGALYAALKAAGHSNPSVKWKQIKDHALDIVAAEAPETEGETEGEGEGEGESTGGAKHTRSIQLRLIEELTALHKACKRESKTLTVEQGKAHALICGALAELGVDISVL